MGKGHIGNRKMRDTMEGLDQRGGQQFERALRQYELVTEELQENRLFPAMELLDRTLALLEEQENGPDASALFVSAALALSSLRLRLGCKLRDVPELLKRAKIQAEKIGDRRSQALINLHQGRFSYVMDNLSDALILRFLTRSTLHLPQRAVLGRTPRKYKFFAHAVHILMGTLGISPLRMPCAK